MLKYTYIDDPLDDPDPIKFHGAVSWLQPESSVGRCCKLQTDRHRAKVTVGANMWAFELPVVVLA